MTPGPQGLLLSSLACLLPTTLSLSFDWLLVGEDKRVEKRKVQAPGSSFFPPGTCGRGGKERASVIYQTLSVFHPRPSILCPLEMVG